MDAKKHAGPNGIFRPFEDLKLLIESKALKLAPSSTKPIEKKRSKISIIPGDSRNTARPSYSARACESENKLFMDAMADVRPIARGDCIEPDVMACRPKAYEHDCDAEALLQLNDLVKRGKGFVVEQTPEYIEGTGHNVPPNFTRRLHRGDFSIQAHLDLHGLGVENAKEAFDRFLKDAVTTDKRGLLIIHGRGLSSPEQPILKTKVIEWLTRGLWRKWVIAYTSARSCDGGTGATYVLLRQRPLTKRFRKRKPRK